MAKRYSNWDRNQTQGSRGNYGDRDNWNNNYQNFQNQNYRGNFSGNQENDYEDEARHRNEHLVGRDFMSNQPKFEQYGQMNDAGYQGNRGNQGRWNQSRGNQNRWNRESQYQGNQQSRFSGQNYGQQQGRGYNNFNQQSDWGENREVGSVGRGYRGENSSDFNAGSWDRGVGGRLRVDRYGEHSFDSGRTPFDESIAGRPYWGSDRDDSDYERSGFGSGMSSGFHSGGSYGYERDRYQGGQYGDQSRSQAGRYDSRYDRLDRSDRDDRDDRSMGDKVRDFFGMGPKGYKRSDDRIREEISEALADHPEINASEIEIQVKDGEVTLTGSVDDRRQKRLAEDVAEDIRGVHDVHNQIRVNARYGTGSNLSGNSGTSLAGDTSASKSVTGSSKKDKDQAA